ncbi:MAG: leucine--tRNA ligase [Chloroflexota bacterium]|nr:leucine--tRNA ligase [Chloroflexota bacterium]
MTTQARGASNRSVERFDPASFESGWRERWEADGLYRAREDAPGAKHYVLTMYPYTSGDLHVGHWYAVTGPDIVARMRRMQGFNVMFPMGFDSFGLPAENAAIDRGVHPADWTEANMARMRSQFATTGCSFDWTRTLASSDPAYYRWTQWLFLQFYRAGLAYRAMAPVDWCPKDQVTLAREQVEGADRHCWRCGTPVEKRDLEQWFFRITNYADELLDMSTIDWPEPIRLMQTNWIGRSEGAEIDFSVRLRDGTDRAIRVFTTRPDTVFGATFMVLAPEHPLVGELVAPERRAEVEAYVARARRATEIDRLSTERERTGLDLGATALSPMPGDQIPIWIADYVLVGYGTGAIMGVPAHDERDHEFARRHQLPIRYVIVPRDGEAATDRPYLGRTAADVLVDSGDFSGMPAPDAIAGITAELEARGVGNASVTYRLRDWLVSRQRYWGPPIPIVYCAEHGAQPVSEEQLPVLLPRDVDFAPTGVSPLQSHPSFLRATCPVCGREARRETDTMDTFVDSSWYYLRYVSPDDADRPWDPDDARFWLPVDLYTGGAEHAVLHLLYARFVTKALRDLGHVSFDEPFLALRNQGQILGADHQRMSKSRGNVATPDELTARYGADTVRLFLMFIGPWDQGGPWNPTGIDGISRFLTRVWSVALPEVDGGRPRRSPTEIGGLSSAPRSVAGEYPVGVNADAVIGTAEEEARALRRAMHRTIQAVEADYAVFRFNTAISRLMELTNALVRARDDGLSATDAYAEAVDALLLLLAPAAPHVTEDLWQRRGGPYSIHRQRWPRHDPALVALETVELPVQVDGKLRDRLVITADTPRDEIERLVLASPRVQSHLAGRLPLRVVHVPGKLVNVVTPPG